MNKVAAGFNLKLAATSMPENKAALETFFLISFFKKNYLGINLQYVPKSF